MKFILFLVSFLLTYAFAKAQSIDTDWYSETEHNGITIQNSFPKGGPYKGPTTDHFNHSYLVFFTRVVNETENPVELTLHFSADSFAIPNSPNTFVKLFLPPDTMTLAKQPLFSYGVTALASLDESTQFQRKIQSNGDCLFYVVAIFYQTRADAWSQERGRNRAELVMKGQDLFYRLLPQVENLSCGQIVVKK